MKKLFENWRKHLNESVSLSPEDLATPESDAMLSKYGFESRIGTHYLEPEYIKDLEDYETDPKTKSLWDKSGFGPAEFIEDHMLSMELTMSVHNKQQKRKAAKAAKDKEWADVQHRLRTDPKIKGA